MRIAGLLPVLFLGSIAVTPAIAADELTPVRGGTLIVNLEPEPTSFLFNSATAQVLFASVDDGLIEYDAEFKPVPSLAQSWEESPDGLSITFHLRHDVKWHDGEPFTSADVQYSIMEVVKKYNPRAGGVYSAVIAVDTPDPYTAIYRFSKPSAAIWSVLSGAETFILPRHLYEGTDPLTNPWNTKLVGTGPFRFKEWVKGQYILLERNPDYWDKGKPYLDRVRYTVIPDPGAREAALEAGEVHFTPLSEVPPSDVARLRQSPDLSVDLRGYGTFVPVFFFEFNLRKPMFQDHRVREAFAHAIDRQALADTVWYGLAKPATGPIPSTQKRFYDPNTVQYDYDLKKAEKLLDEAGYPRGPDGFRMHINHYSMPYGDVLRRAAEYLRESLKPIGIDMQIVNLDLAPFLRQIYGANDFDTYSTYYNSASDPQVGVVRRFWSKAIQKNVAWSNATGYSSPEMDQLIEASQIEIDPEKRRALLFQIQEIAQKEIPSINLLELQHFSIVSKRAHGISTAFDGYSHSLAEAWLAK